VEIEAPQCGHKSLPFRSGEEVEAGPQTARPFFRVFPLSSLGCLLHCRRFTLPLI
jgi:hypothetical protein